MSNAFESSSASRGFLGAGVMETSSSSNPPAASDNCIRPIASLKPPLVPGAWQRAQVAGESEKTCFKDRLLGNPVVGNCFKDSQKISFRYNSSTVGLRCKELLSANPEIVTCFKE